MRNFILSVMVGATVLLFSGCQVRIGPPPPAEPVKLSIVKKDMKIYIDNSLDLDKQKRAVDAFVSAFKDTKKFKVEITPGYLGSENFYDIFKKRYIYDKKHREKTILGTVDGKTKFTYFVFTNTYNYKFSKDISLLDENNGLLSLDKRKFYPIKKYKIRKLDNKSFEIIGFDSIKEALDIWLEIKRTFNHKRANEELFTNLEKNIDDWTQYYKNYYVDFNAELLQQQHRLIISPTILETSMKDTLSEYLKNHKYNVVEKKEDANIIFTVQSLLFSSKQTASQLNIKLEKRIKNTKLYLPDSTDTSTKMAYAANSYSNSTLKGATTGLAALSMLSTSKHNLIALTFVNVFENGKHVYGTIAGTKKALTWRAPLEGPRIQLLQYVNAEDLIKQMKF